PATGAGAARRAEGGLVRRGARAGEGPSQQAAERAAAAEDFRAPAPLPGEPQEAGGPLRQDAGPDAAGKVVAARELFIVSRRGGRRERADGTGGRRRPGQDGGAGRETGPPDGRSDGGAPDRAGQPGPDRDDSPARDGGERPDAATRKQPRGCGRAGTDARVVQVVEEVKNSSEPQRHTGHKEDGERSVEIKSRVFLFF